MAITVNIYYTGKDGSAGEFAREMTETGVVDRIRAEEGNLRYEYFIPVDDPGTVLLIDSWRDQAAIDARHANDGRDNPASGKIRPAYAGGALCDRRGRRAREGRGVPAGVRKIDV